MLLLLLACTGTSPKDTDVVTGDDTVWPDPVEGAGGLAFVDETEAWGLLQVNGAQMGAVDLDADGWPDLVTNDNQGIDDFAGGTRYHWTLMNRPDGKGGRTFVDETEASGLYARREGEGGRPSVQHVFADVDGDGDVDVFAGVFNDPHTAPETHFTDYSDILLNDGTGHFSFAPASPDLQVDMPVIGATFTDADADGIVDLFLGLWYSNEDIYRNGSWLNWLFGANPRLLRGNGDGTFTDVSADAGIEMKDGTSGTAQNNVLEGTHARPLMGATACDVDGDTMPDLLGMAYGRQWNPLWQNRGDGTYDEVGVPSGYAGDDDIDYSDNWYYVCYCWANDLCDAPTDPEFPYTQRQCQSVADAGYWNVGWDDQPANLNGNTFSTACADIDNDGDMDLWNAEITHEWAGGSADLSELLVNDGSGVYARPGLEETGLARVGVEDPSTTAWDFGDQKAAIADLDNDGRKDLILPSGAAYYGNFLYLWRQWDTLRFSEIQAEVGVDVPTAHGIALADYDRDGDLDMVTSSLSEVVTEGGYDHRIYFFENQGAGNHWLRLDVRAAANNSFAIGARVDVTAGGVTQTLEVVGGYGQHGINHEPVLTFGLGPFTAVDEVTVTMPGGEVVSYGVIDADQQVRLDPDGTVTVEEAG